MKSFYDAIIIDYSKKVPGLTHVCGFSKHGFALSPMVGRVVSALLQGKTPEAGVIGFEVDRFGQAGDSPDKDQ